MKYKYFAIKLITKNLVFIDGINRTGKLLTGSLVSSLNNVEHLEFGEIFQHLVPAIKLKKISIDFTKAFHTKSTRVGGVGGGGGGGGGICMCTW